MKILLVEDDAKVAAYIRNGLAESGHQATVAADGRDGLFLATSESYDVVILDRMLPAIDGLTVLRTLRAGDIQTPVLILSALGEIDERIKGLRTGGDDYLAKPFSFAELLARVEVLGRRPPAITVPETSLRAGDVEMNLLTHKVTRGGRPVDLQAREFRLLEYLLRHRGQVVTRTMLLENVWDYHFDPQTNVIDVHISRLRAKLDKGHDKTSAPPLIGTVRGAGYMIAA